MDDALEILEAACERSKHGVQNGPDVRLALGVLALAGISREACRYFWSSAATEFEVGRTQNMRAALNRIHALRSGRVKE